LEDRNQPAYSNIHDDFWIHHDRLYLDGVHFDLYLAHHDRLNHDQLNHHDRFNHHDRLNNDGVFLHLDQQHADSQSESDYRLDCAE
jgi:hypothetical protein